MKREEMARKVWLDYCNKTLRDRGLITDQEYRKIKNKISVTYSNTSLTKKGQGGVNFIL